MKQFSRFLVGHASMGAFLLATSIQAADISSFTAAKGHLFSQTSTGAPVAQQQPYVFRATVEGDLSAITGATVEPPSAFTGPIEIEENEFGTRRELSFPFPGLNEMAFIFGNGNYRFTFDSDNSGFDLAQVTLNSTTFPTVIPQVANFAAAQSVDANADFTVTWNALGDATKWGLIVTGDEGEVFAETGTGTSVTLPMGYLSADSTYTARLRFSKELSRDVGSVPGAVGTAELFNETEFMISTGAGGGGGEDTNPPFLFTSSPANNATGVPINASVSFTFSEEMAPTQSIEWSGNVTPSAFDYSWNAGGRTLVATYSGNLPASSTITWRLNPSASNPANFRDLVGNQLPPNIFQGSFTTGTGTGPTDPCDGGTGVDDGRGFGSVVKMANYVQTGNNAPVVDAEMAAVISGTYRGASNQNVTAVSISGPAGTKNFQNLFGFFFLNEPYPSTAAMEAAVPSGSYTLTATGAGSATLPLGTISQIPVPRIGNLVELGAMNVSGDFTLNFSGFVGAGEHDGIFISIIEEDGNGEFHAPDICKNIELPNNATSVVIPANTFQTGKKYSGNITFSRFGSFDTNSIAGTSVSSSAAVSTKFDFTAAGGQPQPGAPRFSAIRRNANGTLTLVLTADTGSRLIVESSSGFGSWVQAASTTVVGGTYELVVDPKLAAHLFYRAKAQ